MMSFRTGGASGALGQMTSHHVHFLGWSMADQVGIVATGALHSYPKTRWEVQRPMSSDLPRDCCWCSCLRWWSSPGFQPLFPPAEGGLDGVVNVGERLCEGNRWEEIVGH